MTFGVKKMDRRLIHAQSFRGAKKGSTLSKRLKKHIATPVNASIGLCCAAVVGVLYGSALAQDTTPRAPLRLKSDFLGYSFSLSPRVTYTDNINLATEPVLPTDLPADGQTILSNLFTANAIVSNPRFTALFSGDLDFSYFVEDDDIVVNQQVGAAGTATIVDNFLYLDIAGGSSRQLVGDNARFSTNANANRGQQTTVNSAAISPYVYREFANQSVAEVRYRYSRSFIDQENNTLNLNDSRSHEALVSYNSGQLFDRLAFSVTAYGNLTDEDGQVFEDIDGNPILDINGNPLATPDFSFDQGSLEVEAQYALNSKFSITGALGYDEIDTAIPGDFFDDGELSGVFWRAGFAVRPGRRSRLRLEYGRRFGGDFIEADARYQITKRFAFTAGANRTFQTRALSSAEQIGQLSRTTLDFADTLREGGEGTTREIIQLATQLGNSGGAGNGFGAQTIGVGPTNNAFASFNGVFDKTIINLSGTYQNSDFGFRQFENVTAGLNVSRTLSRRVSVFGNSFYRYADTNFTIANCLLAPEAFGFQSGIPGFDALAACTEGEAQEGVTHTLSGTVGLNYKLTSRVRAFGSYTHTQRFSAIDLLEFAENTGTVGLVLDF